MGRRKRLLSIKDSQEIIQQELWDMGPDILREVKKVLRGKASTPEDRRHRAQILDLYGTFMSYIKGAKMADSSDEKRPMQEIHRTILAQLEDLGLAKIDTSIADSELDADGSAETLPAVEGISGSEEAEALGVVSTATGESGQVPSLDGANKDGTGG